MRDFRATTILLLAGAALAGEPRAATQETGSEANREVEDVPGLPAPLRALADWGRSLEGPYALNLTREDVDEWLAGDDEDPAAIVQGWVDGILRGEPAPSYAEARRRFVRWQAALPYAGFLRLRTRSDGERVAQATESVSTTGDHRSSFLLADGLELTYAADSGRLLVAPEGLEVRRGVETLGRAVYPVGITKEHRDWYRASTWSFSEDAGGNWTARRIDPDQTGYELVLAGSARSACPTLCLRTGLVGEESFYTLSFYCPAPVHSNGEELDFFSEALNFDTFGSGHLKARRTFIGNLVVGPLPPLRLPVPAREVKKLLDHRRGRKTFGADPTTWPEELRHYFVE